MIQHRYYIQVIDKDGHYFYATHEVGFNREEAIRKVADYLNKNRGGLDDKYPMTFVADKPKVPAAIVDILNL